jgi:DNA ligase 1
LMSEKLDGVRCYWNGSAMYTRNGNSFTPPDWFKKALPADMALDGELWSKRDDFQKIVSIVRRQDKNEEWKTIKYMVFDAPLMKGTFKQRIDKIKKIFDKLHAEDPKTEFL